MNRIYLDHAATTPVSPEAREAMAACLEVYGNPSSLHSFGREAAAALDGARDTVGRTLGADAAQVCFTSGGTEAANLAVLGRALESRRPLLFAAIEHACVREAMELAREMGIEARPLSVGPDGLVDPELVRRELTEPASAVCVMHVNNEVGTIQPVREIYEICRERDTVFFSDAVQSFGVLPVDGGLADLIAVSSHKVYGPKGVGALVYRPGVKTRPILVGGGQERERRAGTENLAGVVGFAAAAELAVNNRESHAAHLAEVRDAFERRVLDRVDGARITARNSPRHPGFSHLIVDGLTAETVLIALDREGVAASSGAACGSGAVERSHVLLAMGMGRENAAAGLRFTFGRGSTVDDAERAAEILAMATARIRRTTAP